MSIPISVALLLQTFAQIIAVRPLPWPSAPPLTPIEWQAPRPSDHHVWLGGAFVPDGDTLRWRAGRWSIPPEPGLRWEPAQWDDRGGQWVFLRGHYRPVRAFDPTRSYQPNPRATATPPPSPAPAPVLEQHAPKGPMPDTIWIAGYWYWDGVAFEWVAGRWSVRP